MSVKQRPGKSPGKMVDKDGRGQARLISLHIDYRKLQFGNPYPALASINCPVI